MTRTRAYSVVDAGRCGTATEVAEMIPESNTSLAPTEEPTCNWYDDAPSTAVHWNFCVASTPSWPLVGYVNWAKPVAGAAVLPSALAFPTALPLPLPLPPHPPSVTIA